MLLLGYRRYYMATSIVFIMETLAIIGLVLFLVDEILPFIPAEVIPANGIVHGILGALRSVFPKPDAPAE